MKNKSLSIKTVAIMLAVTLLVGGAIGGTIAWLTAKTDTVENVFITSDISIELDETIVNDDGLTLDHTKDRVAKSQNFTMIPGWTIEKDPMVTVNANSESCYLFVKVTKTSNLDDYIAYTVDTTVETTTDTDGVKRGGWIAGTGKDGNGVPDDVYYREVLKAETETKFGILGADTYTFTNGTTDTSDDISFTWEADHVLTKPDVTEEMMKDVNGSSDIGTKPSLKFQAAAVQLYKNNTEKFSVSDAYKMVVWPEE